MGLITECIDEKIVYNPFQTLVYSYRDYNNEVGPFRILVNFAGLQYRDKITLHIENLYLNCTYGTEKYIFELLEKLEVSLCQNPGGI